MSAVQQSAVQNRLLRVLSPKDFALLQPDLELQTTQLHQVMLAPHAPVRHLFFPESGFTSVTTAGSANKVEVGMIGLEGLVGASPFLLGSQQSPFDHFVQSPGEVLSIGADRLSAALSRSETLERLLLRFVQTHLVQVAQTAFVNATYDVESRLARWLLMCQDRMGGTEIILTHDFLSMMLGVQRTSVTLSIQVLEGTGMIRARRGRIEIRDREQMIILADKGYGVPEAEYARLIEGE